jgi:hypothetical protein
MSEAQEQSFEEVVNVFYPDAEPESLEAPTEEASEDEAPDETEELEAEIAEGEEEESEESESSDEETEEEEDVQTVEIDGNEHNLTDIQEWKQAHDNTKSMQADCTKKWQEASDLKKDAEDQTVKAQELTLELEALIAEGDEVDLKELKEDDPDEYIKVTEKLAKRKAKLDELKANQPATVKVLSKDELLAESNDFYAYDSSWQKDGKLTDGFYEDMKLANKYAQDSGYSQEEINGMDRSHYFKTLIDAARWKEHNSKAKATKKKILRTPKSSKTKAKSESLSAEEIFYGKK